MTKPPPPPPSSLLAAVTDAALLPPGLAERVWLEVGRRGLDHDNPLVIQVVEAIASEHRARLMATAAAAAVREAAAAATDEVGRALRVATRARVWTTVAAAAVAGVLVGAAAATAVVATWLPAATWLLAAGLPDEGCPPPMMFASSSVGETYCRLRVGDRSVFVSMPPRPAR